MSRARTLLFAYIAALHALVVVLIVRPAWVGTILEHAGLKSPAQFYEERLAAHLLTDRVVPAGAVVFVGDRQVQGLDVASVASVAVNYGIGGDTTVGVLRRLPLYASLTRARAVVLEVGTNDLAA